MTDRGPARGLDDRRASQPVPEGRNEEPEDLGKEDVPLGFIVQQLACSENALYNILDGLKQNASHVSFFCREFFGTADAALSLEKLPCNERLKRQMHQACVLEQLSIGVTAQITSGSLENVTMAVRSRLRNLLYYLHENCMVMLDFVFQRWCADGAVPLNVEILLRVRRYRRLRRGEHIMALRQHNEMVLNVLRQLVRGGNPKRAPPAREPRPAAKARDVLGYVGEILASRAPTDRLRISTTRQRVLNFMRFRPLLAAESQLDCPWPQQDSYERYGSDRFGGEGPVIYFEALPPMLPCLALEPPVRLLPPPRDPRQYTLVLDLDETMVHYFEEGPGSSGRHEVRPGLEDFLKRMHGLGWEINVFTAATQDYADWMIDLVDPDRYVTNRLYRQHALPWGPIFVKDLSRLGRDMDRTLIIDNVQENFMLQPDQGIFIFPWYDDPADNALFALTPLLEEIIKIQASVPAMLQKYADQIPKWAGFTEGKQWTGVLAGLPDNFDDEDAQMGGVPMGGSLTGPYQASPISGPYQQARR
jgi:Dullard-like phosphatase family protein